MHKRIKSLASRVLVFHGEVLRILGSIFSFLCSSICLYFPLPKPAQKQRWKYYGPVIGVVLGSVLGHHPSPGSQTTFQGATTWNWFTSEFIRGGASLFSSVCALVRSFTSLHLFSHLFQTRFNVFFFFSLLSLLSHLLHSDLNLFVKSNFLLNKWWSCVTALLQPATRTCTLHLTLFD